MYSIEEIRNINKNYDEEAKKLNILNEQVRSINDNIDLEEIKSKLTYIQAKELYKLILSRSNNKGRCEELKKIIEDKKAEEYPEINGVHYYPIIKTIDFLSNEQKINLDKLVKEAYRNRKAKEDLKNLDSTTIEFLRDNSIIEKLYVFYCNCSSIECETAMITDKRFNKLKDYWEKDKEGLTTHEEDKELHYGCFEISCSNEESIEICSLEDFNKNVRHIEYRVIEKPDLSLDKL